jgi:hypothetical protein
MKTEPNIKRDTVEHFAKQGFEFFTAINTLKEVDTTTDVVYVKVTGTQLSKAVMHANRSDEVIVNVQRGRNGRKAAYVVEIPCF